MRRSIRWSLGVVGLIVIAGVLWWQPWKHVSLDEAAVVLDGARGVAPPPELADVMVVFYSGDGGWSDLDKGLGNFASNSFDVVVMTQALQAVHYPDRILDEMLRVGRQCIITFPNFGHWRCRWYLATKGRMPVSDFLPYTWYNTPNIHFCSIKDFRLPPGGTRRFSEYAEGGIITHPTQALMGEAGPEVVIPLTRPARAAELMRMSGLDKMLQPSTPTGPTGSPVTSGIPAPRATCSGWPGSR